MLRSCYLLAARVAALVRIAFIAWIGRLTFPRFSTLREASRTVLDLLHSLLCALITEIFLKEDSFPTAEEYSILAWEMPEEQEEIERPRSSSIAVSTTETAPLAKKAQKVVRFRSPVEQEKIECKYSPLIAVATTEAAPLAKEKCPSVLFDAACSSNASSVSISGSSVPVDPSSAVIRLRSSIAVSLTEAVPLAKNVVRFRSPVEQEKIECKYSPSIKGPSVLSDAACSSNASSVSISDPSVPVDPNSAVIRRNVSFLPPIEPLPDLRKRRKYYEPSRLIKGKWTLEDTKLCPRLGGHFTFYQAFGVDVGPDLFVPTANADAVPSPSPTIAEATTEVAPLVVDPSPSVVSGADGSPSVTSSLADGDGDMPDDIGEDEFPRPDPEFERLCDEYMASSRREAAETSDDGFDFPAVDDDETVEPTDATEDLEGDGQEAEIPSTPIIDVVRPRRSPRLAALEAARLEATRVERELAEATTALGSVFIAGRRRSARLLFTLEC